MEIVDPSQDTVIDLGGREVRLLGRSGHTTSDLTVMIDDLNIAWTGDLVFNGIFPYYGDATPSALRANVAAMVADKRTFYIPGHGSIMKQDDFEPYLALLDDVEAAARKGHTAGKPFEVVAKEYKIPDSLGVWKLVDPDF